MIPRPHSSTRTDSLLPSTTPSRSSDPHRGSASIFPAAARANRGIFYAADGRQRTMADIYQRFADKLDRGAAAVGGTGLASDSAGGGFAAQVRALGLGGESTVITGNGVAADDAVQWAEIGRASCRERVCQYV